MDLTTFIKEALVQIARGIEQANVALGDSTAIVNPRSIDPSVSNTTKVYGFFNDKEPSKYYRIVQEINFDVAVFATEGTETRGGVGIMVATLGLGAQGKSQAGSSIESRIKFTVPMVFPYKS